MALRTNIPFPNNDGRTEFDALDFSFRGTCWSGVNGGGLILRGTILLGSLTMTGSVTTQGALIDSSFQRVNAEWRQASEARPRTDLGRRLLALRKRIVASGEKLLNADEILCEARDRRGENKHDE